MKQNLRTWFTKCYQDLYRIFKPMNYQEKSAVFRCSTTLFEYDMQDDFDRWIDRNRWS